MKEEKRNRIRSIVYVALYMETSNEHEIGDRRSLQLIDVSRIAEAVKNHFPHIGGFTAEKIRIHLEWLVSNEADTFTCDVDHRCFGLRRTRQFKEYELGLLASLNRFKEDHTLLQASSSSNSNDAEQSRKRVAESAVAGPAATKR